MSEEKQPLSPAPEQESKPEPEKKPEHSHKHRQKSVFQYITILFAAAFVLLLYTFMMERRQNDILQQQSNDKLNQLQQQSISAVQSLDNLYKENEELKQSVDYLEEQVAQLEQEKLKLDQDLAAAQDTNQWQQRSAEAMDWFWQVDEAYVRGKYSLCRTLMRHLEDTGDGDPLKNYLPQESATKNGRFSPYDRYERSITPCIDGMFHVKPAPYPGRRADTEVGPYKSYRDPP